MAEFSDEDAEALTALQAAMLGIPIDPAVRGAVAASLMAFAGYNAAVEGFEEPDAPDPAAVYRP